MITANQERSHGTVKAYTRSSNRLHKVILGLEMESYDESSKEKTKLVTCITPFEMELFEHGFECRERKRFEEECKKDAHQTRWKNPPRFKYKKGSIVVLTESIECPWRTVQKIAGGHLLWFVDFPRGVDTKVPMEFMGRV